MTIGRSGRRAGFTTASTVLAMAATAALAAPANADSRNGVCEGNEFCYYYNSDFQGSVSDFIASIPDYGTTQPSCYEFKGPGNGKGQCIKNNAASVWNRSGKVVRVYYNSNYGGTYQEIPAYSKRNLNSALENENASHQFGPFGSGLTGAEAARRAKVWVDNNVPYSQTNTYQGYRMDCSGYVSMAWGLAKPGRTTRTLGEVGRYIDKSQLKRGDALLAYGSHVTMFDKWANTSHTYYWGYEESPSQGATYRQIPYPYWSGYGTFKPFRYRGMS